MKLLHSSEIHQISLYLMRNFFLPMGKHIKQTYTHPSHNLVTSPPGPRNMKNTLQFLLIHRIEPYMVDGIVPPQFLQRNHQFPPHRRSIPTPGRSAPPQTTLSWRAGPCGWWERNPPSPALTALHSPSSARASALPSTVSW